MNTIYNIVLVISVIVAIVFALLVFFTGKGDAMSGSSAVRTSFKGKASVEDQISKMTLFMGIGFMALMLVLDVLSSNLPKT